VYGVGIRTVGAVGGRVDGKWTGRAAGPLFLSLLNFPATTTMAPPTQSPAREGRSALEDCLGGWLNGNHQAELRDIEDRLEHAERIADSAEDSLNSAIRYYNQWSSLDDGVSRVQFGIEEYLSLGPDMIDARTRHILTGLQEGLYIARRIAMQHEIVDLTTDEEMDEDEEHAIVIDLTQD